MTKQLVNQRAGHGALTAVHIAHLVAGALLPAVLALTLPLLPLLTFLLLLLHTLVLLGQAQKAIAQNIREYGARVPTHLLICLVLA